MKAKYGPLRYQHEHEISPAGLKQGPQDRLQVRSQGRSGSRSGQRSGQRSGCSSGQVNRKNILSPRKLPILLRGVQVIYSWDCIMPVSYTHLTLPTTPYV